MIDCRGKYYAMNVPLKDGIDDQSYAALFKPVMSKLIEVYQPQAVVFQSGMHTLLTVLPHQCYMCAVEYGLHISACLSSSAVLPMCC